MRRRQRMQAEMPERLRRFDWREWRPPAAEDDPSPWYGTWYLGTHDWLAARGAWLKGEGL